MLFFEIGEWSGIARRNFGFRDDERSCQHSQEQREISHATSRYFADGSMAMLNARLTAPARILDHRAMKSRLLAGLLSCFLLSSHPARSQDSANWEKITAVSPDKKFAMRIVCDSEPEDADNIDGGLVKAFEIVSLPGKEIVGALASEGFGRFRLIWSSDSKWCAFYSMSGPRVGDTSVHRLQGDKFVLLDTGQMSVPVKGDARNQYIEPVRWLKPGTLLLKQYTIMRGGTGDSSIQFTVRFDDSGKFHVISKKKTD
jgi:hypothetical protein